MKPLFKSLICHFNNEENRKTNSQALGSKGSPHCKSYIPMHFWQMLQLGTEFIFHENNLYVHFKIICYSQTAMCYQPGDYSKSIHHYLKHWQMFNIYVQR